ncbi:unnamed protein product [marine sediment metagenome]|uniref:Uncharacterized protein n=1 Tax=marine sediment metagenome TaxID=412755 RepID=X1FJ61_9ZZZZ
MNPKSKRLLIRAFADFIAIVVAIAGEAGVAVIENAFEQWQSARKPKTKTAKKRAKRKKS